MTGRVLILRKFTSLLDLEESMSPPSLTMEAMQESNVKVEELSKGGLASQTRG